MISIFGHYSKTGCNKCLKLKNMLYDICQIPCSFCQYSMKKLEACRLNNSKFYPWIFFGEKVQCIVYVDGFIIWARNDDVIHNLLMELQEFGV